MNLKICFGKLARLTQETLSPPLKALLSARFSSGLSKVKYVRLQHPFKVDERADVNVSAFGSGRAETPLYALTKRASGDDSKLSVIRSDIRKNGDPGKT